MSWKATSRFSSSALLVAVCCSSVTTGNEVIYDNFNDADTDNEIGVRLALAEGPGSIDASSGDLVMSETQNSFTLWELREHNDELIDWRSEISFRVRMTVDEILGTDIFFAGMGTSLYYHAAIVDEANDVRLRTGRGRINSSYNSMPYDVIDQQLFVQLDMFDGMLTSHAWVPGDLESLVELDHRVDLALSAPVVGIRNGTATIHELLVFDAPLVIDSADGDYNANGVIDAGDTQILVAAFGSNDLYYDRNDDREVNSEDLSHWVHVAANTWIGDANLDGEFNSGDLVAVFEAGKFERDLTASWSEGDWDGDGHFGTADLVAAFQDGGYELGPRMPINAVPEPASIVLLMGSLIGIAFCRRRWGL